MTANPDVLGPEEEVDAAWASLAHHQYRHLPVVDGHELVGVVSLRDLMGVARLRPADEHGTEIPAGLEGVVAAETALGDVRGEEGFFHYRQYSAVDLAARRSLEDVWYLLLEGELPTDTRPAGSRARWRSCAPCPLGWRRCCPTLPRTDRRSKSCGARCRSSAPSSGGVHARHRRCRAPGPDPAAVLDGADDHGRCLQPGCGPSAGGAQADLSTSANYLWMVTGSEPTARHARASSSTRS